MIAILFFISNVFCEYMKSLSTGKWLSFDSDNNEIVLAGETKAVKLIRERALMRPDEVTIKIASGDKKFYATENGVLKATSSSNDSFGIYLVQRGDLNGFAIKKGDRCLLLHSKSDLRFGNCNDENLELFGISELLTGNKMDDVLKFTNQGMKIRNDGEHVQGLLKWSEMSAMNLHELLVRFDPSTCEHGCRSGSNRVFVKFNKF